MRCPSCNAENDTAAPSCAACGHRLPPRPIGTGSLIASRYEILGSLGAGGMGLVFKARDRALDETVALKVLRASASRDPGLAQRFRSEIKLAWKVRHRNVCGIHEYGEDGDLLYISMELVEGKDLRHTLRENGPLTWGDAYDVATQIAEGLLAIHQAGVIHRDLKPANLMRDAQGLVRLMDFGIAKVWGEESGPGVTATGHVVGSPEYMSPEQVRGKSIDFRSDLYALGLVVYEIFTGRIPFQADTPAASMLRRLEEDASLEGSDAALIPRALVPVLRRALARDPDERFATCSELLEALRAARAALPNQITDQVPPLAQDPTPPRVAPAPLSQAAAAEPSLTAFPASAQAQLLVPQLSKALAHADRAVRLGAAQALGRVGAGAQPAIPALIRALADEAWEVRAATATALGLMGRSALVALPVLEETTEDADERVRIAAKAAAERLSSVQLSSDAPVALDASAAAPAAAGPSALPPATPTPETVLPAGWGLRTPEAASASERTRRLATRVLLATLLATLFAVGAWLAR